MVMRFLEDRKCQFIQGKEEDERKVQSIEKNSRFKTKNVEGLSACTDQLRQIEINYILFKKLPLQTWSILKSTLEDFSNWLSNYLGWQAKCFEMEFVLNW